MFLKFFTKICELLCLIKNSLYSDSRSFEKNFRKLFSLGKWEKEIGIPRQAFATSPPNTFLLYKGNNIEA